MEKNVMTTGVVEFDLTAEIKVVYADSFTGKDGLVHAYYRALVPAKHGLKEIAITEALYDEIREIVPSSINATAIYDCNYGKLKLDTLH